MKNIKLFNKILLSIGIIFIILILILFILGNIERVGYLSDISINADDTLELNNIDIENTKKLFSTGDKLDYSSLTNYIFTNSNISKYSYNFRISYYSKIFRNSDIYGVYADTNKIIQDNNFIKEIKFDYKGSPFGILVSSKIIGQEKIDNIQYSLRLKFFNLFMYLTLFYIFIILLYVFRKFLLNIFHYIFLVLKKYKKLLLIYFMIYMLLIVSLFILGRINREGYLSDISINADDTLKLNNVDVENTKKLFYSDDKLDYSSLTNYIFTNSNISKYSYNFRIKYYSKIFRNSDIYGVYLDTGSLPDYMSNVKFHEKGSPFGILSSNKKILENVDNVQYSLKPKFGFLFIILALFIVSIIFIEFFIKFYNVYKTINYQYKYSFILIIFLCFLIMPNIIYNLFYDKFDHNNYDNRVLDQKPNLSFYNLSEYPNLYDKYFNDYIPFRNELIQLKNIIDIRIFKNIISDKVILGKEKWLFLKTSKLIDNYIGLDEYYFSNKELEELKDNLLYIRDKLKDNNMDFVFMICPNKEFIYTNYMPNYLKRNREMNFTEEIVKYIKENTDIKIFYPKDELIKYKDKYQLYYKYDHHWNALGAYIGYKGLIEYLNLDIKLEELSNLNILSFNSDYRTKKPYYYSETANIIGLSHSKYFMDDNIFVISNYISTNTNIMINNFVEWWEKSFYFTNQYPYTSKNIYFIRDSMVHEMLDYVIQDFVMTSCISYNNFDEIIDVRNNYTNIVIWETIEYVLKDRILNIIPKYKIEDTNKN